MSIHELQTWVRLKEWGPTSATCDVAWRARPMLDCRYEYRMSQTYLGTTWRGKQGARADNSVVIGYNTCMFTIYYLSPWNGKYGGIAWACAFQLTLASLNIKANNGGHGYVIAWFTFTDFLYSMYRTRKFNRVNKTPWIWHLKRTTSWHAMHNKVALNKPRLAC